MEKTILCLLSRSQKDTYRVQLCVMDLIHAHEMLIERWHESGSETTSGQRGLTKGGSGKGRIGELRRKWTLSMLYTCMEKPYTNQNNHFLRVGTQLNAKKEYILVFGVTTGAEVCKNELWKSQECWWDDSVGVLGKSPPDKHNLCKKTFS